MHAVQVRYARIDELPLAELQAWLSPLELARMHAMRSERRRTSWLAGRIVLKQLLREAHDLGSMPGHALHIDSQSLRPRHGERPQASLAGRPLVSSLSLAHSEVGVLAAICQAGDRMLGVDLVRPLGDASVDWVFTPSEREWLQHTRAAAGGAEQIWATKEALYKACQCGEGFAPLAIDVAPGRTPRYRDIDTTAQVETLQTWRVDGHVAALAVVYADNGGVRSQPTRQAAHAA